MPETSPSTDRGAVLGPLTELVVDSAEPVRIAQFWGELLGLGVTDSSERWAELEKLPGDVQLGFQSVPERKVVKNRVHLDLSAPDNEAAFQQALELGGRHVADVESWRVLADPEGNEFCVEGAREGAPVPGRWIWAIGIDCADPERLAEFWGSVLGLTVRRRSGPYVLLEPLDGGVSVYFQKVPEPKTVKNRIHLDFTPASVDAASERLVALGGRVIADIETWRVMADSEGNEFCLLQNG